MKKVILKLEVHDDKIKQKAMKTVSGLSGVESISMDMKDKKLTVIGDIDPVEMVAKLRKLCHADILLVGPAKEPEKKKEEKKADGDAEKKKDVKKDDMDQILKAYQAYYNQHPQHHFPPPAPPAYPYYRSAEEDPNACVIC